MLSAGTNACFFGAISLHLYRCVLYVVPQLCLKDRLAYALPLVAIELMCFFALQRFRRLYIVIQCHHHYYLCGGVTSTFLIHQGPLKLNPRFVA